MVYKGRKDRRKRGRKNTTGKEKENYISRACPKRLIARFHDRILNLFTLNPIFWPKIRLAFFPALYKFIVWATWALIHSRFGFKPNLVLTIGAVCGKLLDLIRKRFGFSAQNGGIRFASTNGRATSGQ